MSIDEDGAVSKAGGGWGRMLVRGCAGGDLRHSLAERTKALAAKCHALAGARSPSRPDKSAERRRPRHRKSQTRWYVKVSWAAPVLIVSLIKNMVVLERTAPIILLQNGSYLRVVSSISTFNFDRVLSSYCALITIFRFIAQWFMRAIKNISAIFSIRLS